MRPTSPFAAISRKYVIKQYYNRTIKVLNAIHSMQGQPFDPMPSRLISSIWRPTPPKVLILASRTSSCQTNISSFDNKDGAAEA